MIPNFTNSAPSPFPVDPREDHDPHDHHHFFIPNYQTPAASSSSVTYSVFFSPPPQDPPEYCHVEMHQDQPQREDANHALYTGSYDPAEKKPNKGLKISLRKNSEINDHGDQENPVKWMSREMRLMQKMTKSDITAKPEDHPKQPTSSSLEVDHFSSSNSSSNNSNATPFRVCADCNTTRTPLWRSGPKGPKSLCNACGIRQRKARRAMAAAAAAAANGTSPQYETKASVKNKVQNKEKVMKNNGQTTQFKKRTKVIVAGSSQSPHAQQKNNVFEDFLFNLSKKLAFHRVFPQDEKEAAILLMALSCGLVHG